LLSWSPDGRYLAFVPVFTNSDLVSSRIQMLRYGENGIRRPLVQFDREITGLTWSPDGFWLAFSSGFEVWGASMVAFENDDNPLVRIARAAGSSLSWQPVRN
jgi:Tol biopolymer transport system component